jgi:hypothetical protein
MNGTERQSGNTLFARIGAVCFVLWGVIHIVVGALMLHKSVSAEGLARAGIAWKDPAEQGTDVRLVVSCL